MAVGGLPSKRQGRLGRPKGHRHPHAMASFFIFFAISHSSLHLLPSSTSPAPSPAPSPSPPSPAPSPSPPSPAPSPPPLLLLPRPLPRLLLLLLRLLHLLLLLLPKLPFPLLFTTSCETSHRLRLFGATPRDQARYPPTRIRPCHSGLPPPGHVIGPIRSFSRPTLRGWNRSDGLRLTLRNLP
jgi:hypothetical protein